ncbi:aldehyde-ferredoxin oxidoreductase [Desulforapulum autotrophicum HRM2]|uniref:Aldehyde-ferredoxin oxidoreductase n=1 Tax=Desulforapulum autotrophicum (strain ATCC 43914 / DSM 3382 / VKM B-1955 / HRM2) TaxID=177437 RepID=C0Q9G2_DESAH|nr:aldehyde ferredoxin oxidoreductase C-terminal domain-containing protein [Desulforapulum autotrophicum]ACN14526.1 aldehyde-ferredoxin oxidoreductase [Desulforapulum autotrophicum HRM2]
MKGCFFKLLKIDATTKTSHVEGIDREMMALCLGGKGLATQLLLENNRAGVDPLGPDNHLIIASGPLAGSSLYGSSRYGIFAKSPLTGFYGESYSGGNFARPLSRTGVDAVMIKGISDTPVWIEINPNRVLFHDASNIWGQNTFETEAYLKQNAGGKAPGIMVIGPGGEKLVRFAVIKNNHHQIAGRTGMGAVLGSKKIKGIVYYGDRRKTFHDPDGIDRYNRAMLTRFKDDKGGQAYGTMGPPMMYSFGGLCMIDEIEEIVYLNWLCDSLGIDTISAGNLAAFAIEASKKGKINERLSYGSAEDVAKIIKKIARRQGVGGVLAEGIKPAAEEFGMQETCIHARGMEAGGYDPRILKRMGLAYAVSERDACHLRTTFYKAERSGMMPPEATDSKIELFKDFEDRCTLFDSFILCRFFKDLYPWEELSKVLFLATGLTCNPGDLSTIAAGIKDNTRRFNLREGLTSADDTLPPRLFGHNLEGGGGITQEELEILVSDYYRIRGWDAKGIPLDP